MKLRRPTGIGSGKGGSETMVVEVGVFMVALLRNGWVPRQRRVE